MPKAMLTAIFFDHFQNFEFPAEHSQKIVSSETAPISSLGDMPASLAAAEKAEFWTENGKDKKSVRG